MQKTVRTLILSSALLYSGFAFAQEYKTQTATEFQHQIEGPDMEPSSVVHPDSPAPPLTQFIDQVCSATAGCETLPAGALSTTLVHGGSYIDVYIWELGYGVGETASQGGNALTSAYLVAKSGFCPSSGGGYTTSCLGQTYVGYVYEWNVTHYVEGNYGNLFAAQDTSINSPFNTIRTSFTIKH
jgi:Domain of unknown function (DUF4879)